jgi:hypothetical protein
VRRRAFGVERRSIGLDGPVCGLHISICLWRAARRRGRGLLVSGVLTHKNSWAFSARWWSLGAGRISRTALRLLRYVRALQSVPWAVVTATLGAPFSAPGICACRGVVLWSPQQLLFQTRLWSVRVPMH